MDYPQGIDISIWQNYLPAIKGLSFAFARASVAGSLDQSYGKHRLAIRKAGLILGAYHYLVYGPGGARQAELFLSAAGDADILAMDIESSALKYPQTGRSFIYNLKKMDKKKRPILLYSSQGTWPGDLGQDANWVARWGSMEPTIPWKFWQYQGVTVDRDYFNGTLSELKAFAGVK